MDLDSEEDLEKMESDLKHMAQKVSEYRKSLPDHLINNTLASHRFDLPNIDPSAESEKAVVSRFGPHVETTEQESRDRLIQLKERVYENISTVPLVVQRMRDCKDTIDEANSLNGAFTRRKTK